MPALCAAISFSFKPPIGRTSPFKETSPVIAISERTFLELSIDDITLAIAIPALGPSFGVAPSGTCRCKSYLLYTSLSSTLILSSISLVVSGILSLEILNFFLSIRVLTTL